MSQEKLQQSYENTEQIRTAVNRLIDLLEWLHPEPSPDIFTLRDYRNRYPFTRLGSLAVADIDRYQRINRAIGDHVQMGLYDFHIGLIYLHEGAFRGAVTQFDQARQQWSFVNQSAAVALTHLARAVALKLADHYESAMVSAGRVAGWLERSRFDKPMLGWPDFEAQVLAYVAELQAKLRQQMEAAPQTAVIEPDETETDAEVQKPYSNMGSTHAPVIPVPGHSLTSSRYDWYIVEVRPSSGLLPEINSGDWLLVDLLPDLPMDVKDTEQPILVMMDKKLEDTIRVRPLEPKGRFQRIYLVSLADSETGSFWLDEMTGTVTFSTQKAEIGVNRDEILGTVVGFWRPMIDVLSGKRNKLKVVDIKLNIDFYQFTFEKQGQFIDELSREIEIDPDEIQIRLVSPGSSLMLIELDDKLADFLLNRLLNSPILKKLGIISMRSIDNPNALIDRRVRSLPKITLDSSQLRPFMAKYFNKSELRNVCVDLHVDYENLLGEGKGDKARELVLYLERRGRLDELIKICVQRRPKIFLPLLDEQSGGPSGSLTDPWEVA